jgi:hypothetical protein
MGPPTGLLERCGAADPVDDRWIRCLCILLLPSPFFRVRRPPWTTLGRHPAGSHSPNVARTIHQPLPIPFPKPTAPALEPLVRKAFRRFVRSGHSSPEDAVIGARRRSSGCGGGRRVRRAFDIDTDSPLPESENFALWRDLVTIW